MIKNERQYLTTKAQAEKFEQALAGLQKAGPTSTIHPRIVKAQEDAIRSQLADLKNELTEFEALRAGTQPAPPLAHFWELPHALIRARIASGLSQRELAEKLGLKEQQIQRYEATEYASASFARLTEIMNALSLRPPAPTISSSVSLDSLFKRLRALGFERSFVEKRLIPRRLLAQLQEAISGRSENLWELVVQAAEAAGRAIGFAPDVLLGQEALVLNTAPVGRVRYKTASRVDQEKLGAYTVYAHYLALLLLEATDGASRAVPSTAAEFRASVTSAYGQVSFEHVIRYVWDLGIPVLPLADPGAFHGACWRVKGRNVIVLKQHTTSLARWLFDLLHEVKHVSENSGEPEFSVVEAPEGDLAQWNDSSEQTASQFAGDVILDGRAEDLAQLAAERAKRYIPRLKSVVPQVALESGVWSDALANYVAFRLSLEGENWWGTANTLQTPGPSGWGVARDLLLERADFSRLNQADQQLLELALSEQSK